MRSYISYGQLDIHCSASYSEIRMQNSKLNSDSTFQAFRERCSVAMSHHGLVHARTQRVHRQMSYSSAFSVRSVQKKEKIVLEFTYTPTPKHQNGGIVKLSYEYGEN